MHNGMPYSTSTELVQPISSEATEIHVEDISMLAPAPAYATIGTDESGETIEYRNTVGNTLTDVVRGVQRPNENRQWNAGSTISNTIPEIRFTDIEDNVRALDLNTKDTTDNLTHISNMFTGTSIPENSDLNLIIKLGRYFAVSEIAESIANQPHMPPLRPDEEPRRFSLEIVALGSDALIQRYATSDLWFQHERSAKKLDNDKWHFEQWYPVPIGVTSASSEISNAPPWTDHYVEPHKMRQYLLDMPKLVLYRTRIYMLPGVTDDIMDVRDFWGPGILDIIGAESAAAARTGSHTVGGFIVRASHMGDYLRIMNFRCTHTLGVSAARSLNVHIQNNHFINTSGTVSGTGIEVGDGVSDVYANNNYFENLNIGIRTSVGKFVGFANSGNNCNYAYSARRGGDFLLRADGLWTNILIRHLHINTANEGGFGVTPDGFGQELLRAASIRVWDIEVLQRAIDGLPLYLTRYITFLARPGTLNATLAVRNFRGAGLSIRTANASGVQDISTATATHNITRVIIENNHNEIIDFRGFNITTATAHGIEVLGNTRVHICDNRVVGTAPGAHDGIYVRETPDIWCLRNLISNRRLGISGEFNAFIFSDQNEGVNNRDGGLAAGRGCIHLVRRNTCLAVNPVNNLRTYNSGIMHNDSLGQVNKSWIPMVTATWDIGTSALRVRDVHASRTVFANGVALTSDANEKTNESNIPSNLKGLLKLLKPKAFNFKDEPVGANLHIGLFAQDVEAAMDTLGIENKDVNLISYVPIMEECETGEFTESQHIEIVLSKIQPDGVIFDELGNRTDDTGLDAVYEEKIVIEQEPVMSERQVGERVSINMMELLTLLIVDAQEKDARIESLEKTISNQAGVEQLARTRGDT